MDAFSRTELLLGPSAMEKLQFSRVAVFGVGGVGSFVAEALARSGVGAIDLYDRDIVSLTNINRQLIATHKTLGRPKVDVMCERIEEINPLCKVGAHKIFYTPENAAEVDLTGYHYIVDAIDTVTAKLTLVEQSARAGVPVISSMGAGNKLDPKQFEVADIYKTSVCPLARVMRKELKKRGIEALKVVYSKEPPRNLLEHEPDEVRRQTPGSVSFVPSVVGLILASEVILDLVSGLLPEG